MKFDNYNHFKFYSLKIAKNKNISLSQEQISVFDNFQLVYDSLSRIEDLGFIKIESDFLYKICETLKNDFVNIGIHHMQYFIKKFNKVQSSEIDFYYMVTSLKTMFDIDIEFLQKVLSNRRQFPYSLNRLPVLELLENEEVIHTISELDLNFTGRYGVYFIYNCSGELSYIGKSSTCVLTRCLGSVRERSLFDFLKIELYETKSKSDVAIYEAYYISKLKPEFNSDLVFEDSPTMELPELAIVKEIVRDPSKNSRRYKYQFIKKNIIDLIFRDLSELVVYNCHNVEQMLERGYMTEQEAKNKIYLSELAKIRENGQILTSEIRQINQN